MALTDENGGMNTTMLVSPTNAGYGNQGGFGDFGGSSGWWIILLFLLLLGNNGWGNNAGNGYSNGSIQRGFDQNAVMNGINGVQNAVQNVSTQLCNGFANAETSANARQIANMQQGFGIQTAMMQGFNQIDSQFADCCCENRLATCQTQNIVQNEGNMTRFADANNTRDIIQSQTSGTQAILDKLCQLELDGVKAQVEAKNDRIAELQSQLNMANLAASQTAQNAFIAQGFSNEVDQLYNRLNNCPVPTTPVYGRTPIFTCPNNGCGCGA